jgi:hypothetical protein
MCALRQPGGYPASKNAAGPHYAQTARKKVRYLIWKVKSTTYDASDFFRQADPRREERQVVETRGPL